MADFYADFYERIRKFESIKHDVVYQIPDFIIPNNYNLKFNLYRFDTKDNRNRQGFFDIDDIFRTFNIPDNEKEIHFYKNYIVDIVYPIAEYKGWINIFAIGKILEYSIGTFCLTFDMSISIPSGYNLKSAKNDIMIVAKNVNLDISNTSNIFSPTFYRYINEGKTLDEIDLDQLNNFLNNIKNFEEKLQFPVHWKQQREEPSLYR